MIIIRDNIKGGALTETTFLVLLSLYRPNHGYGIMQFIEERTCGRVLPGAGTLYGALNALLSKKWIAPWGEESDGKKKMYIITDTGKAKAVDELTRLEGVLALATQIIEGEANA